jgi:hypothetical protein
VYLSKSTFAVHVMLSTAKPFVNSGRWTRQPKNVDHPWSILPFTTSSSSQILSYQNDRILNLCCCQERDIRLCLFCAKGTPPLNIYLRGAPKNNWNLNVARELEVVAQCAASCRESTQYSSSLQRGVSLGWVLLLLWLFFSKCLLGGLAIFMMADNKEQRVCVKFCFLFPSLTLFVLYYQPS